MRKVIFKISVTIIFYLIFLLFQTQLMAQTPQFPVFIFYKDRAQPQVSPSEFQYRVHANLPDLFEWNAFKQTLLSKIIHQLELSHEISLRELTLKDLESSMIRHEGKPEYNFKALQERYGSSGILLEFEPCIKNIIYDPIAPQKTHVVSGVNVRLITLSKSKIKYDKLFFTYEGQPHLLEEFLENNGALIQAALQNQTHILSQKIADYYVKRIQIIKSKEMR